MSDKAPRVTADMWARLYSIRLALLEADRQIKEIDEKYGLGDLGDEEPEPLPLPPSTL